MMTNPLISLARLGRFELPTYGLEDEGMLANILQSLYV